MSLTMHGRSFIRQRPFKQSRKNCTGFDSPVIHQSLNINLRLKTQASPWSIYMGVVPLTAHPVVPLRLTFTTYLCLHTVLHSHTYTYTHTHTRCMQSDHRCQGGDGGHLVVVGPGLQVLQGVERGVVQAQGVLLQGLAQGLLEGFLLELQHQSVGLLPLSLPLLRSLSPGDTLHLNFYIYSFSRRSYQIGRAHV